MYLNVVSMKGLNIPYLEKPSSFLLNLFRNLYFYDNDNRSAINGEWLTDCDKNKAVIYILKLNFYAFVCGDYLLC